MRREGNALPMQRGFFVHYTIYAEHVQEKSENFTGSGMKNIFGLEKLGEHLTQRAWCHRIAR